MLQELIQKLQNSHGLSAEQSQGVVSTVTGFIKEKFPMMNFGIGVERALSLDDIGRKYDLTTERVRQIKDKALEKLKATGNINLLRGFLGS